MRYQRPQFAILSSRIDETRRFIQVVTGPRQVGKTTLVQQVCEASYVKGFSHFVISMPVRLLPAGAISPSRIGTHRKIAPFHGAHPEPIYTHSTAVRNIPEAITRYYCHR